jgi:hypothetical protein
MQKKRIALRIDDIFASTKLYEVYGREDIFFSNLLFLKYIPGLRRRLPYREITAAEWEELLEIFAENKVKVTLGITATWVEENGSLTPFFEKFPEESKVLKRGLGEGIFEIANHGYTHCVVGKHLPRLFSSNRKFHREFWDWVPVNVHQEHMRRSQELISEYFGKPAVTFIPPGNVWTKDTEKYAFDYGIKFLASRETLCPTGRRSNGLIYVGDSNTIAFHDREIVLNGIGWLESLVKENSDKEIVATSELGKYLGAGK